MARSNVSQGSRRDARNPAEVRWPRVGVRFEDGAVVVRELAEGEASHLPRAVVVAEPEDSKPSSLVEALRSAATTLAASIRSEARRPVEVVVRVA
jgi:hypothetical protein